MDDTITAMAPYSCADSACPYSQLPWLVPVDYIGAVSEPDTRCPECYGPGQPHVHAAAAA